MLHLLYQVVQNQRNKNQQLLSSVMRAPPTSFVNWELLLMKYLEVQGVPRE